MTKRLMMLLSLLVASVSLGGTPVLRVNGVEVTKEQLELAKRDVRAHLRGKNIDEQTLVRQAVNEVMFGALLADAAREAKLTADDKIVEANLAAGRNQFGGAEGFAKFMKDSGLTEADIRGIEQQRALIQRYVETQVRPKVLVSPEAVKQYYDSHPTRFKHEAEYKVRTVFVLVPQGSQDTVKEQARKKLDQARARIAGGEDFGKVAGEVSDDPPTKGKGGDMGWVPKGLLIPEFEAVVFALKVGQLSDVFASKFGFHLFKVDAQREAGPTPFEEVKESLTAYLVHQQTGVALQRIVSDRRQKAKIEVLDASLSAAVAPESAPTQAGGQAGPPGMTAPQTFPTPAAVTPHK